MIPVGNAWHGQLYITNAAVTVPVWDKEHPVQYASERSDETA